MRCFTLADALSAAGWACGFACTAETTAIVPGLSDGRHEIAALDATANDERATLFRRWPQGCDLLIVDHYERDAKFESACRGWARRIFVIDDLANRFHDCDFLHDPLAGRQARDYAQFVAGDCRLLCGPAYVPLRQQFFRGRAKALARRRNAMGLARIVVTMGATDPNNATAVILEGMRKTEIDLAIDVVMGPAAPHLESVRALALTLPQDVLVHVGVTDMAALLSEADLAVGGAGVTSLERCVVGLPSLLVVAADNQIATAAALSDLGAAEILGLDQRPFPAAVADAVLGFVRAPARVAEMARRAATVCDGRGSARLAMQIAPVETRSHDQLNLRLATAEDAGRILDWQQSPGARQYFRNPVSPTADEHWRWLSDRLRDPGCILSIILCGDQPVGVLRLDSREDTLRPVYEVSILIGPNYRGQGIGKAALQAARRLVPEADLEAEVSPDNQASKALFASSGYEPGKGRYVNRSVVHGA